jgi:hypothetical protein
MRSGLMSAGERFFRFFFVAQLAHVATAAVRTLFTGKEIPYLPQEDDPCDDPDDDDDKKL